MGFRRAYRKYVCRTARHLPYEGLTVPLRRSGMDTNIAEHLYVGLYERPEIDGLRAVIRPGDRVLELGSGLGIITALAARQAAGGQVLSFEANPGMIADTRAFLAVSGAGNAELRHGVLVPDSAAPGETRSFHLAASFAESSLRGGGGASAIAVPAFALADVIADFRPDVLLCDIEGAEAELVPALDASRLRAAVIELHPDRLSRAEVAAIYTALAGHGLFPCIEHSSGTVVVFERVGP